MKKTLLFISVALLICFGIQAQTTHNVSITDNFSFDPNVITINEGDKIRWTNNSTTIQTSTSGTGAECVESNIWDSGNILAQGTYEFIFLEAGTYNYFSTPFCNAMMGTITVLEVNSIKNGISVASNMKSYPNPFASSSTLEFFLSHAGNVKVEVYDMVGKKISETAETSMTAGSQTVKLDGTTLLEGMYVCKIIFDGSPAAAHYVVKGQN